MARTDKTPARSNPGRNPAESTESLSEAASSPEDLTRLIEGSLQSTPTGLSLETKLGIVTITILVFTFGFLVYRKVDLHQQQLMQVRGTPGASGDVIPPGDSAAAGSGVTESLSVDGSVSGASSEFSADSAPASPAGEPVAQSRPENAELVSVPAAQSPFAEESLQLDGDSGSGNMAEAIAQPEQQYGDVRGSMPELSFDEPDTGTTGDSFAAAPREEISLALTDSAAELTTGEIGVSEDEPEQSAAESSVPELNLGSAGTADPAIPDPTSELAAVDVSENNASSDADPDQFSLNLSVGDSTEAAAAVPQEDLSAAPASEVVAEESEPALIAMVEPQQEDDPFFSSASRGSSSAPQPQHEPQFQTEQQLQSEQPGDFPSDDENAATPARVEAGSESGGKFSLRGFNYQDNGNSADEDSEEELATYDVVTVENGDNYSKISRRVYGSSRYFSALAVFNQNRISDPRRMRPGMRVLTPPAEVLEKKYPQLLATQEHGNIQRASFIVTDEGGPAYRVGERETLSEIAERFLGRSSRWTEIYRLNQSTLKNPNKLKPGTILVLPPDAVQVNVAQ